MAGGGAPRCCCASELSITGAAGVHKWGKIDGSVNSMLRHLAVTSMVGGLHDAPVRTMQGRATHAFPVARTRNRRRLGTLI
jgi:hypothetical protein